MKKANKKQVNNQQVNNNGCQHVQLGGVAYYDDKQYFSNQIISFHKVLSLVLIVTNLYQVYC